MRTYLACIPCLLRQAGDAIAMASDDDGQRIATMRAVLAMAAQLPMDQPPPLLAGSIHRLIRESTGVSDPYAQVKARATTMALSLADQARAQVEAATDPFEAAVRLAIAGNVLDFGAFTHLDEHDIERAIAGAFSQPLDATELMRLKQAAGKARAILYLADNTGETVFDRLLIERLPAGAVTYAVKSGPIINDATAAEALAAGIRDVARIVETGSDMPGTMLEHCSPVFRALFETADLVIAKGQANYESLCDAPREVFFLTQVKCAIIARDMQAAVGQWIVRRGADSTGRS